MTTTTHSNALSILSEEETMFREAVRDFAESEVRPHVSSMDEAGQFRADILAVAGDPVRERHRSLRPE